MALALGVYNKYRRILKIHDVRDLGTAPLECLTQMIPRLNYQVCFMNLKAELKVQGNLSRHACFRSFKRFMFKEEELVSNDLNYA